jgi:hypothetical protein
MVLDGVEDIRLKYVALVYVSWFLGRGRMGFVVALLCDACVCACVCA